MAVTEMFPRFIHVTSEGDLGTDDHFYDVTTGAAEEALTKTTKTAVATYERREVKEGRLEPVFSTIIG